ncbi:uncharacterized protein LOC115889045 [Sitophilus oryzae]|uniref:Uncharacterized protein LOC115889045 n=1 Tax=Sitophilus oryzae TaxID=7048 RepID=A0A6J2YNH7_SITOR|nr:uncharacterized protein LOC115889045 [Sitophilus oryzae]
MNICNYYSVILVLFNIFTSAMSIDCFKCISVNRDFLACEDPFHNNFTSDIYESPCMGGRKGREGFFPATSCVKITGVFDDNQTSITIRGCALDSGTLTTDTEIVRMSHCGSFYYSNRYVKGCVQSCNDADGCNSANKNPYAHYSGFSVVIPYIILNIIFT